MPIRFDQSLQYQFVLFLEDNDVDPAADLKLLPDIISEQHPNTKSFGLKLIKNDRQATIVQVNNVQVPSTTWSAGSGIWRLVWTPIRMDLFFDASGFADIASSVVSDEQAQLPRLGDVIERVKRNLGKVVEKSSRSVNRMALVVTGKASCASGPSPVEIVSRAFFNEAVVRNVKADEVRDLTGRVNINGDFELPHADGSGTSFRVNQIEQGAANWHYEDRVESFSLTWLLDVNTSPAIDPSIRFVADTVPRFLDQAEAWIRNRQEALNEYTNQ